MASKFQHDVLLLRKSDILEQLNELYDKVKKTHLSDQTLSVVSAEVAELKLLFNQLKIDIFKYNARAGNEEDWVKTDDLLDFHKIIFELQTVCMSPEKSINYPNPILETNKSGPGLEGLSLENWDGDISAWSSWSGMFTAMVDQNPRLSDSQKLLYLRKHLSGEPLAICAPFEITNDNYQVAWNLIKRRYQNERRLASFHLSKITKFKKTENLTDIPKFLTLHRTAVAALKKLDIADLTDFILFYLAYNNLDSTRQTAFDMSRTPGNNIPKLEDLFSFLEFAAGNLELKNDVSSLQKRPVWKDSFSKQKRTNFVGVNSQVNKPNDKQGQSYCPMCTEKHHLFACVQFRKLTPSERLKKVEKWQRCTNCLALHKSECPSEWKCLVCDQRHHTMLHIDHAATVGYTAGSKRQVLLGTIVCGAKTKSGNVIPVRCLCDSGAQTSVATSSLGRRLGLPVSQFKGSIQGLASTGIPVLGTMEISLCNLENRYPPVNLNVKATVVRKVCGNLPSVDISPEIKRNFSHLALADRDFTNSSGIDLILGADTFFQLLADNNESDSLFKDPVSGLVAQKTIFGFIIQGAINSNPEASCSEVLVSTSLEEAMENFWKIEEIPAATNEHPDNLYCENLFKTTTQRLPDGKFAVRLPFRMNAEPHKLRNRNLALASFKNLEKRLSKNKELSVEYNTQIQDYLKLNHMNFCQFGSASYVLPQLLVLRESSLTTQVRICFNASALTYPNPDQNKSSLNDLLLTGPKLQSDLSLILMRFRLNEVGLIADVEKMFRMIEVLPEDRKYLHVFYRQDSNAELQELEFNVLPFGLRCSPYIAQRVVQETIDIEGHLYPEAATALRKGLYVDDFVGSCSSIIRAKQLKKDLCALMLRGGFTLRKWACSHPEVLADTPYENKGKIQFDENNTSVKVLGLQWEPFLDSFTYKITPFNAPIINKRNCLSYIARTFDCLGFVSPVIFWMKIYLQKLWTLKVAWDDPLSDDLISKWTEFIADMSYLNRIRISRCIARSKPLEVHLACFSDGSQLGYAACIYLVVKYQGGEVTSNLLIAKSKLAPLKTISVPRIELCGAHLMAKLCNYAIGALEDIQLNSIHLFTDSQIILYWIKTPPYQLKTFVANRIAKIQELTSAMRWSYVPSEENPSDCASRGMSASDLLNHSLWWAGPKFLVEKSPENWIRLPGSEISVVPELKETFVLITRMDSEESYLYTVLLRKFSSLTKLQRVLAFMLRFIFNCRNSRQRKSGPLSVTELDASLKTCVRISQQQDFSGDIVALESRKPVSKRLSQFSPFFDDSQILRVGGRLQNSALSEERIHPILLAKDSPLSKLICEFYHKILLHAGPRTTRAVLQRRFWIIAVHSLLRKVIHNCLICVRWRAKTIQPVMGELPPSRVQLTRCFSSTAMDFAGPFSTKESLRKKSPTHKSYLCVFVCEATKAVHIEGVTELSTSAFLAAFDRFIARRSLPLLVRSDNGRNFIGARRHMLECQKFLEANNEEILSALASRQITWKLNPAGGPHFGGLHEAAVKSIKTLLLRTVGPDTLTIEEFFTLLARVEAILNSRPISFISSEPMEGVDYLSPGHFLVGGPLVSFPENSTTEDLSLLKRWSKVKQMHRTLWKRFRDEYLHTLMQKQKWTKASANIALGQVVYITGINTSPLTWPIGRVSGVYPGADGVVRVVDVTTTSGVYRRPVNKLVVVPLPDSEFRN